MVGRGVAIFSEWRESFVFYFADMGPRPSSTHMLERFPEPGGPFTTENRRWVLRSSQKR